MKLLGFASRFRSLFRQTDLPFHYRDGWQANTPLDDTTSKTEGLAAINRGVAIIVGNLLSTPLLVKKGRSEAAGSPVGQMLKNTRASDLEACFYDMIQTGNGWLRIKADRLEHIQAHRMSAQLTAGGDVEYLLDSKPIAYSSVVHLMCRNAYSSHLGESLLEHHSTSASMLMATASIYKQLQGNGSHAETFISTDLNLTKEQIEKLREAYNAQTAIHHGKAGGAVILSNGLKPMTIKSLPSALDADIVESLNWSVAEAARMTGVPLSFLAVKDATAYNSAIEAGREFLRNTLRPIMKKVEHELTYKLGGGEYEIYFDLGELVLGFGNERADVLSKLTYSGLMSLNEARETLGYGAVENGDVRGLPSNQLPFHHWLDSGQQAPANNDANDLPPEDEFKAWRKRMKLT